MTNQDRIRELEKEVARLVERIDRLQRDIDAIAKAQEEGTNRRWALMLALVGVAGGVAGGVLTELFKVVIDHFQP